MVALTTAQIDTNAVREQARLSHTAAASGGTFDNVLNTASYTAGVFGPAISSSVYSATGPTQGASIISAALNATATPGTVGFENGMGMSAGTMGTTGGMNYLTGGLTSGGSPMMTLDGTASSSGSTDFSGMINQFQSQASNNIILQAKVSEIQIMTTGQTNIIKSRKDSLAETLRNFS
jgi:hypothetical protein